jgi:hypothetical protein
VSVVGGCSAAYFGCFGSFGGLGLRGLFPFPLSVPVKAVVPSPLKYQPTICPLSLKPVMFQSPFTTPRLDLRKRSLLEQEEVLIIAQNDDRSSVVDEQRM